MSVPTRLAAPISGGAAQKQSDGDGAQRQYRADILNKKNQARNALSRAPARNNQISTNRRREQRAGFLQPARAALRNETARRAPLANGSFEISLKATRRPCASRQRLLLGGMHQARKRIFYHPVASGGFFISGNRPARYIARARRIRESDCRRARCAVCVPFGAKRRQKC